jgi:hypothetical protein
VCIRNQGVFAKNVEEVHFVNMTYLNIIVRNAMVVKYAIMKDARVIAKIVMGQIYADIKK